MNARVCICCGKGFSKEPEAYFGNPNLCASCTNMPEWMGQPELEPENSNVEPGLEFILLKSFETNKLASHVLEGERSGQIDCNEGRR